MQAVRLGALAAALLFSLPVSGASTFQLLSHRAVYELSLAPGKTTGITGLSGRMVLEWADVCEGYTTQQRMVMRIANNSGKNIDSDFRLTSWESKDGKRYRFDVRSEIAGAEPEVYKGRANRTSKSARADFRQPKDKSLELPKNVVFPSEHIKQLIEGAQLGKTSIPARLFDGSGEEGLYLVSGLVLGKVDKLEPDVAALSKGVLKGVPAWRVRLSFFSPGKEDSLPEYEVGLRLFANGVADKLVLDYGDFAVAGKLSSIVTVPGPDC